MVKENRASIKKGFFLISFEYCGQFSEIFLLFLWHRVMQVLDLCPRLTPQQTLFQTNPKTSLPLSTWLTFAGDKTLYHWNSQNSIKQNHTFICALFAWDCINKIVIRFIVNYCLREILSILASGCTPCVTSLFCNRYVSLWSAAFISSSPFLWALPRKSTIFRYTHSNIFNFLINFDKTSCHKPPLIYRT